MLITDLESCRPVDRSSEVVLLTPETAAALAELSLLFPEGHAAPQPLTAREYEREYRRWLNSPELPRSVKEKANRVGIEKGYDAAMRYYRSVFDSLHANLKPPGKPGRPDWYVSPVRAKRIRRGDIIARLINIGAETLRDQSRKAV